MRLGRLINLVLTAALVVGPLTACTPDDDSNGSSPTGGASASAVGPVAPGAGATSAPATTSGPDTTLEMPAVPTGKWAAAGQLCGIITSKMASDVLGRTVTGAYSHDRLPANGGIDACTYGDSTSPGYSAQVGVFTGDEAVWEATRTEFATNRYDFLDFTVKGVDRAMFGHDQAFVLKGGRMASANNGSLGKFDAGDLVTLAAMALNATS